MTLITFLFSFYFMCIVALGICMKKIYTHDLREDKNINLTENEFLINENNDWSII